MLINLSKFLLSDDVLFKIADTFTIDDEDFVKDNHINGKIVFNGEFFKVENSLLLKGSAKYSYTETCARCITEFENKAETKFEAVIIDKYREDSESDEIEIVIKDGCVNLDEPIMQAIYSDMPMKALCKKDCLGLCPTCGVNLNIEKCQCENIITDPRLEKLKSLLKD